MQLRVHPSIIALREKAKNSNQNKKFEVDLTYLTSRGHWYHTSWKGDPTKSGGIATNIGVHFYDMLAWVFGDVQENIVHFHEKDYAAGYLEFANARVRWFLSVNAKYLPQEVKDKGQTTFRSITIDGQELEFSNGFTDLHTISYQDIIEGEGFGLEDARQAIQLVHDIRGMKPVGVDSNSHVLANLKLQKHPFDK